MSTTTMLPVVHIGDPVHPTTIVFCTDTCRSAFDGPTVVAVGGISSEQVQPAATCWCCGAFLRPERLAQCEDCGRLVYYDDEAERYRHAELAALGCFLVGPEPADAAGWSVVDRRYVYTERATDSGGLQIVIERWDTYYDDDIPWSWTLTAWGTHYLADTVEGNAPTLSAAQRDGLAALRDALAEPARRAAGLKQALAAAASTLAPRHGYADVRATVRVRVNLRTKRVDLVTLATAENLTRTIDADLDDNAHLSGGELAEVQRIVDTDTWPALEWVDPSVIWEG